MLRVGKPLEDMNLTELSQIRTAFFIHRLIIMVVLCSAGAAAVILGPWPVKLLGSILLGLMYAHGVELQHQCLHHTAFKSRSLNRFVGVLVGLPSLVSYSDYQFQHLRHHRLLGTDDDREFFNYGYEALSSFWKLVPHLFMVRHYRDVAVYMFQSIFGGFKRESPPEITAKIRNEYRLMLLFIAGMITATVAFETPLFVWLWLIPLFVAVPTHALIELPEHIGCETSSRDVLKNTRTIKASKLASWFVNGNNYHVEHHWLPSVPNDKLADLHQKTHGQIDHYEMSYWSFYRDLFKQLMGSQTPPSSAGRPAA